MAFDIAAAVAYALTEGFTPETEHLIAPISSLASESVADDVLIATYAGASDIDAARASLARIPKELHRLARIPFIAKAQARNGEYAAARSTAKAIPDLSDKIHALSYAALHQAGDPPDLPSAARLGRKNRRMLRDRALGHIARVHLAARNLETAQQAAKLMSDRSARNELLSQTANLQEQTDAAATAQEHLASGDFGAALAAAEILIEHSLRDAVLQQIARGQLQAGNPSDAHTTAARITGETIRDTLVPDIARAFADNGDFDQALETAHPIGDATTRDSVHEHIALTQLSGEQYEAALATAQLIGNVAEKDGVRGAVSTPTCRTKICKPPWPQRKPPTKRPSATSNCKRSPRRTSPQRTLQRPSPLPISSTTRQHATA